MFHEGEMLAEAAGIGCLGFGGVVRERVGADPHCDGESPAES